MAIGEADYCRLNPCCGFHCDLRITFQLTIYLYLREEYLNTKQYLGNFPPRVNKIECTGKLE